jgi:hypothetical protein
MFIVIVVVVVVVAPPPPPPPDDDDDDDDGGSARFNSRPYTTRGVPIVRTSNMNPDEERVEA